MILACSPSSPLQRSNHIFWSQIWECRIYKLQFRNCIIHTLHVSVVPWFVVDAFPQTGKDGIYCQHILLDRTRQINSSLCTPLSEARVVPRRECCRCNKKDINDTSYWSTNSAERLQGYDSTHLAFWKFDLRLRERNPSPRLGGRKQSTTKTLTRSSVMHIFCKITSSMKHNMKPLSRTSFSPRERLACLVLEICPKMHLALETGRKHAVDALVDVSDGILVREVNEKKVADVTEQMLVVHKLLRKEDSSLGYNWYQEHFFGETALFKNMISTSNSSRNLHCPWGRGMSIIHAKVNI